MDMRIKKLAENLVNYSCSVKQGEKVLIESNGTEGLPLVKQIIKEVYKVGGIPYVNIKRSDVERELLMGATEEQLKLLGELDKKKMERMDAFIGINSNLNQTELSDVPGEKMSMFENLYSDPVHFKTRVEHTKWVVLRYPTNSLAQSSSKSLEAFEDFYYDVCNLDYAKMEKAMLPLKELMGKTDKVKIVGEGTNLSFSIKDIPVATSSGKKNIPDGEIYTAPVKESVNGVITYNAPSILSGFTYENVKLEFKDGKIVKATANDTERINKVFNTDDGARYVGEFAIGVNPYIEEAMKETLFDEKIMGSFHFTPGNSYDQASNGNKSSIHWDLVCIQTKEYGGGEIYFDDVLVRKDGLFVLDELKGLNPENLK